jgi:putative flippase GtrA
MSFGLGVIVNYILCNFWVFKTREWAHNPWMERFLFLGTALLGLGINSGALILFVSLFHQISFLQHEQAEIAEMAAKIVATGIAFFWNYWSKKVFVYQKIK